MAAATAAAAADAVAAAAADAGDRWGPSTELVRVCAGTGDEACTNVVVSALAAATASAE
jgi:hypothetical protein